MLNLNNHTTSINHSSHIFEEGISVGNKYLQDKTISEKKAWAILLKKSEESEKSPLLLEEFEQYFINLCQQKTKKQI